MYIITTDGTALLSKKYGSLEVDESLISGFITAINTFASQIIQREVDEIVMGDLKFTYSRSPDLNVIYAVCADSETSSEEIKDIFDQVDDKFIEKYKSTFNDDLLKDLTIFNEFIPTLDSLVHKMAVGKEDRTLSKSVVSMFKKLIQLTTSLGRSPEETSVGEVAQDTTIEITQPEGLKELNNVYVLNTDVFKNARGIPYSDAQQRLALQYINGSNTIEDIIISLQLLGYRITSAEKLIEFFKECANKGYLKLVRK